MVHLGVQDYLDVKRLVSSRDDWTANELRRSLCAVLATRREDLAQIESLFQVHLASGRGEEDSTDNDEPEEASDPPVELVAADAEKKSWADRLAAALNRLSKSGALMLGLLPIAALLLGGLAITLGIFELEAVETPPTSSPRPSTESQTPAAPEGAAESGCELVPISNPRTALAVRKFHIPREFTGTHVLAFIPCLLLMTLGLRWLMLPADTRRRREAQLEAEEARGLELRRQLSQEAAERGEARALSYRVPTYKPLSATALDDGATLLGRIYRQERSLDLDVPATVRATIRAGGRVVPRFAHGHGIRELRVLIDIERGDHPWLGGFQRVLDHLERLGVRITRYTFQHVPASVTPAGGGPPLSFEELTRRYSSDPLVLFSRRLSPQSREELGAWTRELKSWPLRAWIDPDPRPLVRRRRGVDARIFERLRLPRFPWTDAGFLALAEFLASDGEIQTACPVPDMTPPLPGALRAWAVCAALVPDATWDQLEAVRRHPEFPEVSAFLNRPWHLQHLLDWVETETGDDPVSGDGRTLELSDDLVERLIREQRRTDPGSADFPPLEERARRFLEEQLAAERPPKEHTLSRLWWELKRASHRMVLQPEKAVGLMERFRGSAVEREARQMLTAELKRQRDGLALVDRTVPWATAEKLRAMVGEVQGTPLGSLLWGRPRLWASALILAMAFTGLLVTAFWAGWGSGFLERLLARPESAPYYSVPADYKVGCLENPLSEPVAAP